MLTMRTIGTNSVADAACRALRAIAIIAIKRPGGVDRLNPIDHPLRKLSVAVVVTIASLGPFAPSLRAHPFEVFQPEVEQGRVTIEIPTALQTNLPRPRDAAVREVIEAGIYFSVTGFWKIKPTLDFVHEDGRDWKLEGAGLENIFSLFNREGSPFKLGWFTAVEFAIDSEATNAVGFGPIIKFAHRNLSLTLNPFLAKTFGQNREQGTAFVYGWAAMAEILKGLEIGVEAYGVVENIGDASPFEEQQHRIGPVVTLVRDLHSHAEAEINMGVLFGYTQATPDVTYKFNLEIDF